MENQLVQTNNNQVAQKQNFQSLEEYRVAIQNFTTRVNSTPPEDSIDKTADGKAKTVVISHIEMTLDEFFFGQWDTENFKWSVIANEIVGSMELVAVHPVTGREIRRTGAAAIQIMVDKAPEDVKGTEKNKWALNPENKKSNALDMGFPKLKAECLKNAAQSFGKLFGRDLNRKIQDNYKPLIKSADMINTMEQRINNLKSSTNGK